MINTAKPTTTLLNTAKVSFGETWATMTHSWASELRTWMAVGSLFTNQTKQGLIPLWSGGSLPWLLSSPWTISGVMINQPKP